VHRKDPVFAEILSVNYLNNLLITKPMRIKDIDKSNRPRERLMYEGVGVLSE